MNISTNIFLKIYSQNLSSDKSIFSSHLSTKRFTIVKISRTNVFKIYLRYSSAGRKVRYNRRCNDNRITDSALVQQAPRRLLLWCFLRLRCQEPWHFPRCWHWIPLECPLWHPRDCCSYRFLCIDRRWNRFPLYEKKDIDEQMWISKSSRIIL